MIPIAYSQQRIDWEASINVYFNSQISQKSTTLPCNLQLFKLTDKDKTVISHKGFDTGKALEAINLLVKRKNAAKGSSSRSFFSYTFAWDPKHAWDQQYREQIAAIKAGTLNPNDVLKSVEEEPLIKQEKLTRSI